MRSNDDDDGDDDGDMNGDNVFKSSGVKASAWILRFIHLKYEFIINIPTKNINTLFATDTACTLKNILFPNEILSIREKAKKENM